MECSVENNSHRSVGEDLAAGSQSKSVGVVMYGSKLCKAVDPVDDFICNESCFLEYLSALHDPVTDSVYLAHRVDYLALACCEDINELFKSFGMCGEIAVKLNLSSVGGLVGDVTVNSYSVAVALCDNAFIIHIKKLILKRGASCVYN